jgi:hypothetical protein
MRDIVQRAHHLQGAKLDARQSMTITTSVVVRENG